VSPSDADERVAKMKDGSTHLAHKAEHAVDITSGAVIAVTLQAADEGDTTTIQETLAETATNLAHLIERESEKAPDEEPQVSLDPLAEIVADKGYHSNDAVMYVQQGHGRSYIPEPKRGRRRHTTATSQSVHSAYFRYGWV
jgi:transposase